MHNNAYFIRRTYYNLALKTLQIQIKRFCYLHQTLEWGEIRISDLRDFNRGMLVVVARWSGLSNLESADQRLSHKRFLKFTQKQPEGQKATRVHKGFSVRNTARTQYWSAVRCCLPCFRPRRGLLCQESSHHCCFPPACSSSPLQKHQRCPEILLRRRHPLPL